MSEFSTGPTIMHVFAVNNTDTLPDRRNYCARLKATKTLAGVQQRDFLTSTARHVGSMTRRSRLSTLFAVVRTLLSLIFTHTHHRLTALGPGLPV